MDYRTQLDCSRERLVSLQREFEEIKDLIESDDSRAYDLKLHMGIRRRLEIYGSKLWRAWGDIRRPPLRFSEEYSRKGENDSVRLHLDNHTRQIPWELSFDGENFLGEEADLCRVASISAPKSRLASLEPFEPGKAAIIACGYGGDLQLAKTESDSVSKTLSKRLGRRSVTVLTGKSANRERVTEVLGDDEVSILHFSGHADYDPDEGGGIQLQGGKENWLSYSSISDALSRRSIPLALVFLNACRTGQERGRGSRGKAAGIIKSGLPEVFLEWGTSLFIGTLWSVGESVSLLMADGFYRAAFKHGMRVGSALRLVKNGTMMTPGMLPTDQAAYIAYGDSNFSFSSA